MVEPATGITFAAVAGGVIVGAICLNTFVGVWEWIKRRWQEFRDWWYDHSQVGLANNPLGFTAVCKFIRKYYPNTAKYSVVSCESVRFKIPLTQFKVPVVGKMFRFDFKVGTKTDKRGRTSDVVTRIYIESLSSDKINVSGFKIWCDVLYQDLVWKNFFAEIPALDSKHYSVFGAPLKQATINKELGELNLKKDK